MNFKDFLEPGILIISAGLIVMIFFIVKDKLKKRKNNKIPSFYRPEK